MWLTAAVIALLTAGAVLVLWWPATAGLNGAVLVTARLDALKIGLSIGVGSGGVVALYLAWRRQDSTERTLAHQQDVHAATMALQERVAKATEDDAAQRRLNELYFKAVEQFGSPLATVSHSGLYALERIAQGNPDQRQIVVNVICSYLRSPYTLPPATGGLRPLGIRRPLLRSTTIRRPLVPRPDIHTGEARLQEREMRVTTQDILRHHLQPGEDPANPQASFWPDIDIDLTGATLVNFSLAECKIGAASFRGATFTGTARFGRATFTGDAWFDGARFGDGRFGGGAGFAFATFTGLTRFDGASFADGVWFDGATFTGDAWFHEARFVGGAWFNRAKFTDETRFERAAFTGNASFDDATFTSDTNFSGVTFAGPTKFANASFAGQVWFTEAVFTSDADFEGATDRGRAFDPAKNNAQSPDEEIAIEGEVGDGGEGGD
ncbi:pentapeptide repeat-containing protein [Amycolatopsis sp. NPDC101161]|uniref:pentapeptide repeat-containing protein n=1 Tax=Amycolatopsis sp. NPDC101161 TaxID=3363940 RepID=UPI00381B5B9E